MIKLGTSGFSYEDWIGPVYPKTLPKWQWLSYYAAEFDTVELNVTYYRIPEQKIVSGWVDRTPEEFTFAVKAHQSITHDRKNPEFEQLVGKLQPLVEAGKLACVLAQFPHSFHPNPTNEAYLHRIRDGFSDLPVVVEFRDSQWVREETFQLLSDLHLGFCCVDEPPLRGLMPPVTRATGPIAYIRFHGRNAAKWWDHDQAWERYDYSYSKDELKDWIPKIRQLDQTSPLTLVYANNHYRGQSVQTLRALQELFAAGE